MILSLSLGLSQITIAFKYLVSIAQVFFYNIYKYYNTQMDRFLKRFLKKKKYILCRAVWSIFTFFVLCCCCFIQPNWYWLTKKILPTFRLVRITIHFWFGIDRLREFRFYFYIFILFLFCLLKWKYSYVNFFFLWLYAF